MKETYRAAVLNAFGEPLRIEERQLRTPGPGEVLVKVMASGLCASDLHIQDGMIPSVKLPHVPGHEMAGIVEMTGDGVRELVPGDRVVAATDVTCGVCRFCKNGMPHLCPRLSRIGFERDGSHAEYLIIPAQNAIPFDKTISFEKACVIPDAVTCMYHAIKTKGRLAPGDRILFLGVGGLGFQGIQLAKYLGGRVYATSRKDAKLDIARQFGADATINTAREDLQTRVQALTGGEMCDIVVDAIGIESSIQEALDCLRPNGRALILGYSDQHFKAEYRTTLMYEKEIIGVRASTPDELRACLALTAQKKIDPFVYKAVPFAGINEALDELRSGQAMGRIVLKIHSEGRN
ncbi:alcohol dehydrogenase catalytic domain-containing protein [Anaerotruncus rubiinfantis]|uniref:alcohol dehydrogenase catalytic domain-containing protein n=1 Tax=Anaerotruncus rubiinfantis TaxID=1720200 RepID=UPI0034A2E337